MNNTSEFEYRSNSLSKRIEALDEILNAFERKVDKTLLLLKGVE